MSKIDDARKLEMLGDAVAAQAGGADELVAEVSKTYGAWDIEKIRRLASTISARRGAPEKSTGAKAAQINAAPEAGAPAGAVERLAAIIADADSAASCMFYRGSKTWGEHETQHLLAALRNEAPTLLAALRTALSQPPAAGAFLHETLATQGSELTGSADQPPAAQPDATAEIAKRDRMLDAIEAQLREAVDYADRCRAAITGITGAALLALRASEPTTEVER